MRIILSLLFLAGLVAAGFFLLALAGMQQVNDIDLICGELAIGFGALICAVAGGALLISGKLADIHEAQRSIASRLGVDTSAATFKAPKFSPESIPGGVDWSDDRAPGSLKS